MSPEPVEPKRSDMDIVLAKGCSSFVIFSLIVFGFGSAPILAVPSPSSTQQLNVLVGISLAVIAIIGVIAARFFAVSGAGGSVGGSMMVAITYGLRIQQLLLLARAQPDYTLDLNPAANWMIPLAIVLVGAVSAYLGFRPEKPLPEEVP